MTIDWTAVGSIATAISAIIAFIMLGINSWQIRVLKNQRNEDVRARLSFSILVWEGSYVLKIKNIGKETAYDIELKFSGPLIDNHYSKYTIEMFDKTSQRKFSMDPGKEIYLLISRRYSSDCFITCNSADGKQKEHFTSQQINEWLDEHINDNIVIKGEYCNKYKINESFSITDFVLYSLEFYDNITSELKQLNIYLKKISSNHG